MSDLANQAEPIVKKLLQSDENQLYEELGMIDIATEKDLEKRKSLDPQVSYDGLKLMGVQDDVLDDVLELGKNIFNRWAVEAYKLACGSEDEDLEDRKKLITAMGVSEVAIASAMASLLITQLLVPAAIAPVIAAIAVKRFFRPAYGEFCKVWKKNLPQVE
jgi:hypothetical protein